MKAVVVKARAEHIIGIVADLREADRREIEASTTDTPMRALAQSYRRSTHCWVGLINDDPVLIFGASPVSVLSGIGAPWMIGTNRLMKARKQFMRECRGYVDVMQACYPTLFNYVDDRNAESIRWLKWLGFEMDEPQQLGVNGEMFRPFRRAA